MIAAREHPILFRGAMVRALLAGEKTQTRRLIKPQPRAGNGLWPMWGKSPDLKPVEFGEPGLWCEVGADYPDGEQDERRCPYGVVGDRLYVREAMLERDGVWIYAADDAPVEIDEDNPHVPAMVNWAYHKEGERCNSIHMPRWASRIVLELANLRVERVQSISENDAIAEGLERTGGGRYWLGFDKHEIKETRKVYGSARDAYRSLWDSLNAKRGFGWDVNPWVWALTFRRVT